MTDTKNMTASEADTAMFARCDIADDEVKKMATEVRKHLANTLGDGWE